MGITYLITSITAESVGKTFDKLNYRNTKIHPRQALLVVFSIMTLSVLAYTIVSRQSFPHLTLTTLALLTGIALLSFVGNVFDEVSLQKADLSLREPLVDFEPVLAGLIGYALFPDERKPVFLVAFILGALITRWGTNRSDLHISQTKGIFYLWIATLFYAFIPVFYKEALVHLPPTYIALFRLSSVTLLLVLFFKPKRHHKLTSSMLGYSTLAGIAYAVGAIVSLYAIQTYGLVLTMVFMMLGPAMRYLSGQFILGEKVHRRAVLSSLMLTLVVAIAAFTK